MTERRRRPGRRRAAVVGAVVAIALGAGMATARSGSSSAGTGDVARPPDFYASSPAVCTLLTGADLEAALGRSFAEGEDPGLSNSFADMPGVTKCRYPNAEAEGTPFVEIGVVYAYADEISAAVDKARKPHPSAKVPGLGQPARWYPKAGELLVRVGDKILGVYVPAELLETQSDVGERARRLAAKALERL